MQGPSQRACNDPVHGADQIFSVRIRAAFDQAFLTSIVEKMNLYPNERRSMSPDQVAQKMRANIYLLPRKPKDLTSQQYELQFSYPDPQLAQQVNALLISYFRSESGEGLASPAGCAAQNHHQPGLTSQPSG